MSKGLGEHKPEEHEGEHYLRLLGLEDLAEQDIQLENKTIQARDFLDICGDYARPILVGFEDMDPDDPRYEITRETLRNLIGQYTEQVPEAD